MDDNNNPIVNQEPQINQPLPPISEYATMWHSQLLHAAEPVCEALYENRVSIKEGRLRLSIIDAAIAAKRAQRDIEEAELNLNRAKQRLEQLLSHGAFFDAASGAKGGNHA